ADPVLLDRVGGVDGDLVVGVVTVLDAEVVVLEVDVEVWVDERVFDPLPDDAGHLVAVEFDDRALNLDFRQGASPLWGGGGCCGGACGHLARADWAVIHSTPRTG